MVVQAEVLGHPAGVRRFVEGRIAEPDRETIDVARAELRHHRRHRARVDAAREEDAHRHVADELAANGRLENRPQPFGVLPERPAAGALHFACAQVDVPVAVDPDPSVGLPPREEVTRWQLGDPLEDGARAGHVLEREVVVERHGVELGRDPGCCHDRFQLRAKNEPAWLGHVVERLDPHPVTRQQQGPLLTVPDGESEHAVEALDEAVTPLLVAVHDDLGVAARPKPVTTGDQLVTKLGMVVDLAVEDDP